MTRSNKQPRISRYIVKTPTNSPADECRKRLSEPEYQRKRLAQDCRSVTDAVAAHSRMSCDVNRRRTTRARSCPPAACRMWDDTLEPVALHSWTAAADGMPRCSTCWMKNTDELRITWSPENDPPESCLRSPECVEQHAGTGRHRTAGFGQQSRDKADRGSIRWTKKTKKRQSPVFFRGQKL